MSSMKLRMSAADRAFRSELRFYTTAAFQRGKTTGESFELAEGVGGCAAWLGEQVLGDDWNETMGRSGVSLEVHHATQRRLTRKRSWQREGAAKEALRLRRMWTLATKSWSSIHQSNTDTLMKSILLHAHPEFRTQGSSSAHAVDPRY